MIYVRFPLSLRNVEDLLHERSIDISRETVRFWWNRFGPIFAAEIRRPPRLSPQPFQRGAPPIQPIKFQAQPCRSGSRKRQQGLTRRSRQLKTSRATERPLIHTLKPSFAYAAKGRFPPFATLYWVKNLKPLIPLGDGSSSPLRPSTA